MAAGILTENDKKYFPSRRGLTAPLKEKEVLPRRKSLRLQRIEADTGLQLPVKEPTSYNLMQSYYEQDVRLPLEDLALDEIMPSRDKQGGHDIEEENLAIKSKYLANISDGLKLKGVNILNATFAGDVTKKLERLRITVSRYI